VFAAAPDVSQVLTVKLVTANELAEAGVQSVFPNPTTGLVHLTLRDARAMQQFRFTALNGKEIGLHTLLRAGEPLHYTLDLSNLDAGIYLLRVGAGDVMKIVKL
jgi:hypothetical protein